MRNPDYYTRLMLTLIAFMVAIETNAFFFFEEPVWQCQKVSNTQPMNISNVLTTKVNVTAWRSDGFTGNTWWSSFVPAKQAFAFSPEPGKGPVMCWQKGVSESREAISSAAFNAMVFLLGLLSFSFFVVFLSEKFAKEED